MRLLRRRGTALLRTSALAALLAVALGAASLVVVLALMSGYTAALRAGVLSAGGHLVALLPPGAFGRGGRAPPRRGWRGSRAWRGSGRSCTSPGMLFPRTGGEAELVSVRASDTASPVRPSRR